MRLHYLNNLVAIAVSCLAVSCGGLDSASGQQPSKAPVGKNIDPKVLDLWLAEGGDGWYWFPSTEFNLGVYSWPDFDGTLAKKTKKGAIPAFFFPNRPKFIFACLSTVPSPAEPFALDLHASHVDDAAMKALARFENLEALTLRGLPVSDEGFKNLVGLKKLRMLDLYGTKMRNLSGLGKMTTLQWLNLEAEVDDESLKEVSTLNNLQMLMLAGTKISDMGMKQLAGLTNLRCLNLSATKVGDEGLKSLANLARLEQLGLDGLPLTDDGLRHLAPLKELQGLSLTNSEVTGAGFKDARFDKLKILEQFTFACSG